MPRQVATKVTNKFIRGLITEKTALDFPQDACTETFDCVFDETGEVTRRPNLDFETNSTPFIVTPETDEVFTEFLWAAVAGTGAINYLVQQQGSTLRFYDQSISVEVSPNREAFVVNLNTYKPPFSTLNPALFQCQYASGNGDLFVVNPACDPFYVTYIATSDSVTSTRIILKQSYFTGVEDGLTITNRPTNTVANLKTNNPEHYYNILNQSWYIADALSQWDSARTDMPSNADYVALYRASETNSFTNSEVTAKSPGNRAAPKGHFILDVANPDRTKALIDDGFKGAVVSVNSPEINREIGTIITNFDAQSANAFDGIFDQTAADSAQENSAGGFIGKDFGTSLTFRVASASVYGSNDAGYVTVTNPSTTLELRASASAPSLSSDGTLLGTITFADTANESEGRLITSTDAGTAWRYVWIRIIREDEAVDNFRIAEVRFFTPNFTFNRASTVGFFASRVFYAGINVDQYSNNLYFTQIIERRDQYNLCYQLNDPTSEELFDLLPSDGGVVKIPEIAIIKKIFKMQTGLLIFATNGVWLISGSGGQPFQANDYQIRKLSSVGVNSPLSIVDIRGTPVWWGEDGIYTITFDANYDSYSVISVTDETIRSFFLAIPSLNRQFAKGDYDTSNDTAYWIYNDTVSLPVASRYKYTKAIVFNARSKAFYPWIFVLGTRSIRGLAYIYDAQRTKTPLIKFTTTTPNAGNNDLTYSQVTGTVYKDYTTGDYSSYFITGYNLDGETQRFFQANYVYVFLKQQTDASCRMQAIFDFTTSGSSGHWSPLQQVYNTALTLRSINFRKLKVRGRGRALQLRFVSESGKPFSIVGWSLRETGNSDV